MEQIDPELEYVVREPYEANPRARFNWLYVLPTLGVVWLLYLVVAAIFQLPTSGLVGPVMSVMIVIFFVMAGLLFWAMAPKANR